MNSNKKVYVIIMVLGVLLTASGIFIYANNFDSRKLRDILPSELNNDTAKEIVQFFLDTKDKKEKWEVISASLYSTDGKDGYVINVEAKKDSAEGTWYKQTIITYKRGKWSMELPMWSEGDKDIEKYNEFFGEGE